jgi:O-antigen/teichoic acid export membrane protein
MTSLYRFVMRKLVKETIWSFLSKGLPLPLFVLTNVLLARYLGLTLYGEWSFFFSFVSIILLISFLGLNDSTKKSAAEYNKTTHLSSLIRNSFVLRFIASTLFLFCLFLFHTPILNALNKPDLAPLFIATFPFIFLSDIVEYLKSIFHGLHRIKFNLIINLSEYGFKLLFLFLGFTLSVSLLTVVLSLTLALLITSIIGTGLLFFYFTQGHSQEIQKSHYRDLITYSFPLFFVSIGFAVATDIDQMMLGLFSTPEQTGYFAVANSIIDKLPHVAIAIAIGTMPIFAHLNKKNSAQLKKTFGLLLKVNTFIFGVITLLIATTGWYWIPLIYGADYAHAFLPLVLLLPYLLFYSYSVFLSSFLDYQGKANRRAVNLVISTFINIILNWIFIPRWGAAGTALATSLAFAPYMFFNWFQVRRIFARYTT